MNTVELNHIDLNSIGLNSKTINGVGKSHDGNVKSYIKGHVTDESSTFTIRVNNTDIVIPVDANGNWKWVADRDITSLNKCFNYQKISCDYIEIYLPKTPNLTDMYRFLYATNGEVDQRKSDLKVVIKAIDTRNVTNMEGAFKNSRQIDMDYLPLIKTAKCTNFYNMVHSQFVKVVDLRSFDMTSSVGNTTASGISNNIWNSETETLHLGNFCSNPTNNGCVPFFGTNPILKNVTAETIRINLSLSGSSALTEQSVVNLFNAVAADITLTFHQNVWNMIMREIDVQGSPIQVAYQNMIDNYDVTIANASFDAEIEYIEGTGTQWIDTNIKFKPTTAFETRFMEINIPENPDPSNRTHIIGTYSGNTRYRLRRIESDTLYFLYGSNGLSWGAISAYTDIIVDVYFSTTMLKCKKDNGNWVEKDISGAEQFVESPDTITLFHGKNISNTDTNFEGRFYYLKIWDNDNLVADFIPVRKGTTGYMYDKVSGNLFGNSGTGDFILGNDK